MDPTTGPPSGTTDGREPVPAFCEQCGAPELVIPARSTVGPPGGGVLAVCPSCRLLSCEACWPGRTAMCAACATAAVPGTARRGAWRWAGATRAGLGGVRVPARVRLPSAPPGRRPALAAAASVVVAILVVVTLLPRNPTTGAVGAATSEPSQSSSGSAGAVLAVGSHAAGTPTAGTASGAGPTATTSPAPGATPRITLPAPTPAPGRAGEMAPGPPGPAAVEVEVAAVRPWLDELGEVRAQVLVGVTNGGGWPGYVTPGATSYRVLSPAGQPVAEGRFAHVFPPYVEPGRTAWCIDTLSALFTDIDEVASVEVELESRPAGPTDIESVSQLAVTAQWRAGPRGSLVASGVVRNVGQAVARRVSVAVILLDRGGRPLAGAYDVGGIRDLEPGGLASFETAYPGSAPFAPSDVAAVEAVAIALDE